MLDKNCIHSYNHPKYHYKSFYFNQYFHNILQLIYQLIYFWIYNFHNLIYSPTSHDLSHSQLQLLGFQINPLSQLPLSIDSLHSHLHLSLFQRCLLLQTLVSNLHLHLQVLCYFTCPITFAPDIRLNTLIFIFLTTSGTHNFPCGSLILLQLPLQLLILTLFHYC